MPYVLKHKGTSQLWTSMLVNHYELAYYGIKFWSEEEAARTEAEELLQTAGVEDPEAWEIVEIPENTMKLGNVKLRNDPSMAVFLDESLRPIAERR